MWGLQKYRDALGSPGAGAHKARLGPFALVDCLATLVAAGGLAWATHSNFFVVLLVLVLLAILVHAAFGVRTALNVWLAGGLPEKGAPGRP